ncbi:MAG TPA: DUF362 domain-containing protein [Clostridiales bacterium]|jgi:uncharacterized protein (DUF362 family)/Pyruvate/2-oxoacid:ferredoxin oxidoreductase delta subunit|nr:DUF362 domain-containing protein [Clostridiales bacterium]
MEQVSIVKCDNYQQRQVYESLSKSIRLLGGMERFVKPGMRVLLKCNLLMRKKPEEAATTHPEVVAAAARLVKEAGGHPIIADSPGGLFTERALRGVYHACGMEEIAARDDIELNYNVEDIEVSHPQGRIVKSLTVIKAIEEVDAVINIAKLKTHGMALYTGAVKNLFGVIPGTAKAEYHLRMKKLEDFSDMLLDISTYVKPVLSIMDAIVGMEGQGPSAGDPRRIGAVLASTSPYHLDTVCVSLVGIEPDKVCTIRRAEKRGLGSNLEKIILAGDSLEELRIQDFKIPTHTHVGFIEQYFDEDSPIAQFINTRFGPRPVFNHEGCIGCRDCEKNCPPEAITMVNRKPVVDLKLCIRCYCCQELCPQKTVDIKRSWLFQLFR